MSRVAINTGSVANDGTGDSLRIAGGKINDNFIEIYNQFGNGSNLTPTWNKTAAGVNTTSNVGVGTTNPRFTLEVGAVGAAGTSLWVNGNARVTGILTVGSSSIVLDGNANKILVGSGISFDGNTGIISATAFYAGGSIITGGGGGGSGDSYWGSSASGISTTANVAIGTVTPTSKLTVVGNSLFSGIATFRSNLTLANLTSSSNTLRFGSNSYIDQSNSNVFTFQITSGTDGSGTDSSFVFRTTEPGISPIPDQAYDALRVYSSGNYWNRLVRVYTNFHADNNAFVGGNLQVGAASTLIGVGNTLGSFKVGAGGTVITTTSAGLVGIGTTNPTSALTVKGNTSLETLSVSGVSTLNSLSLGALTNLLSLNSGFSNVDKVINFGGDMAMFHLQDNTYGTKNYILTNEYDLIIGTKGETGGSTYYSELIKVSVGDDLYLPNTSNVSLGYGDNTTKLQTIGSGITVTGTTFTNQLSVSGIASVGSAITFTSSTGSIYAGGNVSVGGTISIDGAVKLVTNNPTIVGTAGTVGEIKRIAGAPFFYDGSAWREFVLSTGTPVAVPADTEWDNVVLRSTYDTTSPDFFDFKFSEQPVKTGIGATTVASPVKIGTKSFRNNGAVGAGISYAYRAEHDFTGPWTIEFWINHDARPYDSFAYAESMVSQISSSSPSNNWSFGVQNDGTDVNWYWFNEANAFEKQLHRVTVATFNSNFLNQWKHYALVRESSNGSLHFYINGYEVGITTNNSVIDNNITSTNGAGLHIGGAFNININGEGVNSASSIDAHFDDLRITTDARYVSVGNTTTLVVGIATTTTALPTTGTLSSYVAPPGNKYGEITLGGSPTWRGTSGVTVAQQSSGNYRVSFASTYTNSNDYFVLSQGMNQGFASYVGIARSTTHVDFAINRQSNDTAVDTGSLSVQITNHT